MAEHLIYSWDDDKGGHLVCSECLRALGNAAVCGSDDPQVTAREVCDYPAEIEKD